MDEPTIKRYPRTLIEAFPQDYAEAIERPQPRFSFYKIYLFVMYVIAWVLFFYVVL